MITEKDKANEILNKFRNAGYVSETEIKEMSLIAVDLILDEWNNEGGRSAKQNFWQKVKSEIKNNY